MNDFTVKVWGVSPDGTELISGKDAQAIITLLSSEIQAITKRNHALVAQVESCNDALKALLKSLPWIGGSLQADGQFYYKVAESVFKKAESALAKTPQQCLAEIRAEAIESAVTYLAESIPDESHESLIYKARYIYISNRYLREYADKVRQGGE